MSVSSEVGYHTRFEEAFSARTQIKFLTDGVLLREIQADPLLTRYSGVISFLVCFIYLYVYKDLKLIL